MAVKDKLYQDIERMQALEALAKGYVEVVVRIPIGVVLSQDNDDIGENIGVMIEEELESMYPTDGKPGSDIKEAIETTLQLKFD